MTDFAVNPTTGDVVQYDGKAWSPVDKSRIARSKDGAVAVYTGNAWKTIGAAQQLPSGGPGGAAKAPQGSANDPFYKSQFGVQPDAIASSGSGSPVQEAMDAQTGPIMPIDDPTMLPRVGVTGASSFAKDPALKAMYLARKIFPDMAPNDALQRMGSDGKRFYYIANDGKAYYAEPTFSPVSNPGLTAKELPNTLAAQVGPSLPTVGGMTGGILGGPTPASIVSAAGGGMLGESIRQAGAKLFTDELQPVTDSYLNLAKEGVGQGVNQALGLALAKGGSALLERNPLKVSGYDASKMTPAKVSEMQANADMARRMGIDVTPGEAGNVGSLLVNQRQLARQNEGADILKDFYSKRNLEQIPDAWAKYLDNVSPQGSAAVANRELGVAAKAAVETAKAARRDAASPVYKSIMRPDNVLPPDTFKTLMASNPMFKTAIDAVRKDPLLAPLVKGMPDESLPVLDLAKRHLDGLAGQFNKAGDATRGGVASDAAKELRDALDPLFPMYKDARDAFAGKSPEVTALQKGVVGIVSKEKPNGLQNLPKVLFSAKSSDPYSIAQAKDAFQKAGKMDEWNAGVRSFLQNTFDDAVKTGGEAGPSNNLWKNIAGDRRQMSNLKAALGQRQFDALGDFMNVVEMVKRAPAEGSPTATDLGSRAAFAGPVAKGAAATVKGANPLNIPEMISSKIIETSSGKNVEALAKLITAPDAIASLKRLRVLKPGTKAFVKEIGYLSSVAGWGAAGSALNPQTPMEPGTIGNVQ